MLTSGVLCKDLVERELAGYSLVVFGLKDLVECECLLGALTIVV